MKYKKYIIILVITVIHFTITLMLLMGGYIFSMFNPPKENLTNLSWVVCTIFSFPIMTFEIYPKSIFSGLEYIPYFFNSILWAIFIFWIGSKIIKWKKHLTTK